MCTYVILYTQITIQNKPYQIHQPMQISQLQHSPPLQISCYSFHFPSGFSLQMNLPTRITIHEITQIIRSYKALHQAHGLKVEGQVQVPKYLVSLDGDVLVDCYLGDGGSGDGGGDRERELGSLGEREFRIGYGLRENGEENQKEGVCAFRKYHFIGKMCQTANNQTYIAKNRKTLKMHLITTIPKQHLTFPKLESLLQKIHSHFPSSPFSPSISSPSSCPSYSSLSTFTLPIIQTFQTTNKICIVSSYYPFRLDRVTIDCQFLMDVVLGQIAKILHVRGRIEAEGNEGGDGEIGLGDFWMGFDFKVVYYDLGISSQVEDKKQSDQPESSPNFPKTLSKILQSLLQSCHSKLLPLYLPLSNWIKNKRIQNYLDFLKYSQITPVNILQSQNEDKKRNILQQVIKGYRGIQLEHLGDIDGKEFGGVYRGRTGIFGGFGIGGKRKIWGNNQNPELQQLLQNISTVKKKKKQIILLSPQPTHQVLFLQNKLKQKLKKKTKKQTRSMIQNQSINRTNSRSKASKNKKRDRKISEFLIDD